MIQLPNIPTLILPYFVIRQYFSKQQNTKCGRERVGKVKYNSIIVHCIYLYAHTFLRGNISQGK
jgi:hypothetical protein